MLGEGEASSSESGDVWAVALICRIWGCVRWYSFIRLLGSYIPGVLGGTPVVRLRIMELECGLAVGRYITGV